MCIKISCVYLICLIPVRHETHPHASGISKTRSRGGKLRQRGWVRLCQDLLSQSTLTWASGQCPGPRACCPAGHFVFWGRRDRHRLMCSRVNRSRTGFTENEWKWDAIQYDTIQMSWENDGKLWKLSTATDQELIWLLDVFTRPEP